MDRKVIWQALSANGCPPPLLSLLQHLFDDVTVAVVLSNLLSSPFSPATGVLPGSVLSPHLYSIYINSLPAALREVSSPLTTRVGLPGTLINSLLFADDVAILGTPTEVQQMLAIAANHSLSLGYRWSPTKCAVLNCPESMNFTLYGEILPRVDEFVYLGLPFQDLGFSRGLGLSTSSLLHHRTAGTINAMAILQAIGARPSGFGALLSSRLYRQFIRPKFEYGLAISKLTAKDYKELERIQDRCLRMIFGGHRTASTIVFRHICDLPTMKERALILCLKSCVRMGLPPT